MTDEPWPSNDEAQAWRNSVDMHHALMRHLALHLQQVFGLSAPDFEILANLSKSQSGRMRTSELRWATRWEKSRLSHHLSRMQKRGLIRREASDAPLPGDRADRCR